MAEQVRRSLLDDLAKGEVERVCMADGRPEIYPRDRIPETLLGDVLPMPRQLAIRDSRVGRAPRATRHCPADPTVANARLARLLKIKRGAPLLHIDQIDYDGQAGQ